MTGELSIENIEKSFCLPHPWGVPWLAKKAEVIRGFSLRLRVGEIAALVGANGAGKTTILKIAMGMYRPSRGRVLIDGQPAHAVPRKNLGMMMTHRLLYPALTGYENLAYTAALYGCREIKAEIAASSEQWGLQAYLQRPMQEYSQGMRTRLALARATITRPRFLFLDEPFSFLDDEIGLPHAIKVIRALGVTTLITSPVRSVVAFADNVVELQAL